MGQDTMVALLEYSGWNHHHRGLYLACTLPSGSQTGPCTIEANRGNRYDGSVLENTASHVLEPDHYLFRIGDRLGSRVDVPSFSSRPGTDCDDCDKGRGVLVTEIRTPIRAVHERDSLAAHTGNILIMRSRQ